VRDRPEKPFISIFTARMKRWHSSVRKYMACQR